MNRFRLVIGCLGMIMSMALCGCARTAPLETQNKIYQSAQEEFAFTIDALGKKDVAAIKNKFSPYACDNIPELDKKIERLVQEFPGYDGGEVKIKDTFYRQSNYGTITCAYTPSYDFTVCDDTYRMRIIYYVEADEDPDKLGWYSLQLYKRNDSSYSSEMYTHDVDDAPDILLWDYTKGN